LGKWEVYRGTCKTNLRATVRGGRNMPLSAVT